MQKIHLSLDICFSGQMCAGYTAGCLLPKSLQPPIFCSILPLSTANLPYSTCLCFLPGLLMGVGYLKTHGKENVKIR